MNYANIKDFKIKNFRCLDDVTISFDNSPIIALQAGNDSGKSSIVKAIETIIYNDERDIKNYIRTGTKGFNIQTTLEDGTRIERVRTDLGNTYSLYDGNGTQLGTWSKISQDVPDAIARIFGVKVEEVTGEMLNLRTCESLLLFSLTKTTDNYKMVHSCISSQLIEKAYEIGNERIKELSKTIDKSTSLRDDLYRQANTIHTLDEKTIETIKQNQEQLNSMISTEQAVYNTLSAKRNCDNLRQSIESIDITKLNELSNNKFNENDFEKIRLLNELLSGYNYVKNQKQNLNTEKINSIIKLKITDDQINKFNKIIEVKELSTKVQAKQREVLNEERLNTVTELITSINNLRAVADELNTLKSLISAYSNKQIEYNNKLQELENVKNTIKANADFYYDKDSNSFIKKCDKCGENVSFELKNIDLI